MAFRDSLSRNSISTPRDKQSKLQSERGNKDLETIKVIP